MQDLSIDFVALHPISVIYARVAGPYELSATQAWLDILNWLDDRKIAIEPCIGFGHYHSTRCPITAREEYYDACVAIATNVGGDFRAGIRRRTLPGGRFARVTAATQRIIAPGELGDLDIVADKNRQTLEIVDWHNPDRLHGVCGVLVPCLETAAMSERRPALVA